MKIDSGWIWLGGCAALLLDLGLQVFGAKPEIVEAGWRSAIVILLVALGQQIREQKRS